MFELIRTHQLNVMLVLSGVAISVALLMFFTRFLPARRKAILIFLELEATFLLIFDREAYKFAGGTDELAYVMVRLSNFMVFFLTAGIVLGFNLFLTQWLLEKKAMEKIPGRLRIVSHAAVLQMILVIIAHFAGWFYYIDRDNLYHRGPLFLLSYIVPVLGPVIQYSVVLQYRKYFSRLIFTAMSMYIFLPLTMGIVQVFTYGLSLVNSAMVIASIGMYIFTYLDINDEVERVHRLELDDLKAARRSGRILFDQMAKALVAVTEKKDASVRGHAGRVAGYARELAQRCGYDKEGCDRAYYAGLLHDVGFLAMPEGASAKGKSGKETEQSGERAVRGGEILAGIAEYPWLAEAVRSSQEHYDGSGSPDGLKGEEIPELARIIALADACDNMRTAKKGRGAIPITVVREELLKGVGSLYDPKLSELMMMLIDADTEEEEQAAESFVERELSCRKYRERVTTGIEITDHVTKIRFHSAAIGERGDFSAPALILFDSLDRHVHESEITIRDYQYLEYGELWFDGNYVCTGARNMVTESIDAEQAGDADYLIEAARIEDHMRIRLYHAGQGAEFLVALADSSRSSYIGVTGENCRIRDIAIEKTGERISEADIPRIADKVSFLQRMESDLPNVQIDRFRSAYSEGVPIRDGMRLEFHSMSLPTAHLVWHCPHVFIYTSKDGKYGGEGCRDYGVLKLNGENDSPLEWGNGFTMKKTEDFSDWEAWKKANKEGLEYELRFRRKNRRIRLSTETLGLALELTIRIPEEEEGEIYVALTGDQCALTDLRVR